MKTTIRWIVYMGTFLVPLWFLPFTADIIDFNKSVLLFAIASIGLILCLVDMIRGGVLRYRPHALLWGIAGLIIAGIISAIASVNGIVSIFGIANSHAFSLINLFSLGIITFLAVQVIDDHASVLKSILVSSLAITAILAALQMMRVGIFSGPKFGGPSFTTVGSLNALGFLVSALLPFFLAPSDRVVKWERIVVNILRLLGFAASLVILVALNNPSLWIIAFIGVVVSVAFLSASGIKGRAMKLFVLPMLVIAVGVFLWIGNIQWRAVTNVLPIEIAPTQAVSYRIVAASLKSKPLGYGMGNYIIAYDRLRPPATANTPLFQARFSDSASEIATLAVEGGIPFLLALIVLFGLFARELWRQIGNRFESDPALAGLYASCIALFAAFFFYPVAMTTLLVLALLISIGMLSARGIVESERVVNLEEKSLLSLAGSLTFMVGLVAVLVAGYFVFNQYVGQIYLAKAAASPDRLAAVNLFLRGINKYPKDPRPYRLLSQKLIEQIADDLKLGPQGKSQAEFAALVTNRRDSAINVAEQATKIDPANSENWLQRGYVYHNLIPLKSGVDDLAIEMYQESLKRNPANALAYVRIGNVYLARNNLAAAEENYKKAVELYDNYGQASYNLAVVYDRKGELKQAIKQFEKLQASNPRDPGLFFQLGLLYYRNNQKDDALKALQQAVALFPDYSNARWYLSILYEERGDKARALAEIEAVAKFNADNQLVKDRLAQLKNEQEQ